jgi:hypothetical protein
MISIRVTPRLMTGITLTRITASAARRSLLKGILQPPSVGALRSRAPR